jgi:hypothetical protein
LFRDWLEPQLSNAKIDLSPNGDCEFSHVISVSGPSAVEAMAVLYPPECVGLKRKLQKVRWVLAAAEEAAKMGILPGQEGSRRQWVGDKKAKEEFTRRWQAPDGKGP